MELSGSNIKKNSYIFSKENFSYIFSKESFCYISGNGTLHFLPQARKIKEIHSRKISYSSGNENPEKFLIFSQKKAVLMFQETDGSMNLLISMDVFE